MTRHVRLSLRGYLDIYAPAPPEIQRITRQFRALRKKISCSNQRQARTIVGPRRTELIEDWFIL